MGRFFHWCPIPVSEIESEEVRCAGCDAQLTEEAYFDGVHEYYCEVCFNELVETAETAAEEFAAENCKITKPLPSYDPALEYRCTPGEYDAGAKESYTQTAYRAYCRHNCTNYEKLIADLDRDSVEDQVTYEVIRDRIDELLEEAISEVEIEDEDEDEGEVGDTE